MTRALSSTHIVGLVVCWVLTSICSSSSAQDQQLRSDAAVGEMSLHLTSTSLMVNPQDEKRHRGIVEMNLPQALDSFRVDVAELVMTVSTVFDTTDPLILVVAPVTNEASVSAISEDFDWTKKDAGMEMEYVTLTPLSSDVENGEVRLDITPIIDLWQRGVIENRGVVVRTATEGKSKFQWVRTGTYGGAHARLDIKYSRK